MSHTYFHIIIHSAVTTYRTPFPSLIRRNFRMYTNIHLPFSSHSLLFWCAFLEQRPWSDSRVPVFNIQTSSFYPSNLIHVNNEYTWGEKLIDSGQTSIKMATFWHLFNGCFVCHFTLLSDKTNENRVISHT